MMWECDGNVKIGKTEFAIHAPPTIRKAASKVEESAVVVAYWWVSRNVTNASDGNMSRSEVTLGSITIPTLVNNKALQKHEKLTFFSAKAPPAASLRDQVLATKQSRPAPKNTPAKKRVKVGGNT